jgi:probable HAF family extracellular repeat protein
VVSGINNLGQVVGFAEWNFGPSSLFTFSNGAFTPLPPLPNSYELIGEPGINDLGQIVGTWEVTTNAEEKGILK